MQEQNVVRVNVSILENHKLVRDSLSRTLEQEGIAVVGQYGDANNFLSGLERDNPAVAIVELGSGAPDFTVVREARQFHPALQLIVLSESQVADVVQRCFDAGATGYVDKVTSGCEVLVDAVRAVARGERVFPPDLIGSIIAHEAAERPNGKLASLSARERQVLSYVAAGADNLKISICLKISERTVKAHVSSLYRKLGQENRTQLALLARQLGVRPSAEV